MGTPEFAVPCLNALCEYGCTVSLVVTQPDRPAGRGKKLRPPPVKVAAEKLGYPVIQVESMKTGDVYQTLKQHSPDFFVVVAFGHVLDKKILEIPSICPINIHASLLPKYRGLMPSFWVLKNNEKETGVSVFFVDKGIDSGPILVQKKMPINENMTQAELIKKSKKLGMDAIIESIELIHQGNYKLIPNPDKEKTYFSFPTREDVKEFYRAGKKFY